MRKITKALSAKLDEVDYRKRDIMIESLLIGLLIAKIKKLSFKPIIKSRVFLLLIILPVINIIMIVLLINNYYFILDYSKQFMSIINLLAIAIPLFIHKDNLPYKNMVKCIPLALTGAFFNKLAMTFNQGKMPFRLATSSLFNNNSYEVLKYREIYIQADRQTKLIFLADIIDVGYEIYSIGDLLIIAFIAIIFYSIIKASNK